MKAGLTKAIVKRRNINERTRQEAIVEIHRGVVVWAGQSFARIYNNTPRDEGGDVSQTSTEYFPIAGKNCWIECVGELREPIALAAELR